MGKYTEEQLLPSTVTERQQTFIMPLVFLFSCLRPATTFALLRSLERLRKTGCYASQLATLRLTIPGVVGLVGKPSCLCTTDKNPKPLEVPNLFHLSMPASQCERLGRNPSKLKYWSVTSYKDDRPPYDPVTVSYLVTWYHLQACLAPVVLAP